MRVLLMRLVLAGAAAALLAASPARGYAAHAAYGFGYSTGREGSLGGGLSLPYRGLSPEEAGLKPDPNESEISVPPLPPDPPGRQYEPRNRDLNVTMLLQRLGHNFDPRFMSVHRPRNHTQPVLRFPFRHHKGGRHGAGRLVPAPGAEMPPFLRRMNFKSFRLPNGTRLRTHVSPRLQKKLQHFLWAWTACPVQHKWRDLGVRYFPRYVLEGTCPSGRGSCSVPPGMTCAPSQRVLKVILRWQCSLPGSAGAPDGPGGGGGGGSQLHCYWMEINNYPIVTACSCGCPSNNGS